ncbi:MAG: hypothetical protein HYS13_23100 [Planctomycetia bacterium]|nr:hypothetical protein [Planctomycetia bacterium]
MPRQKLRTVVCGFVVCLVAAGCGSDPPKTLPELKTDAQAAADKAKSALGAKDAAAAEEAAVAAEEAARQAGEIVKAIAQPTDADRLALRDVQESARQARHCAVLTAEIKRLDDFRSGWKLALYKKARGGALSGSLLALSFAADEAGKTKPGTLPDETQKRAQLALELVQYAGYSSAGKATFDGPTDWPGISADLKKMSDQPPARLSVFLSFAALLGGQYSLALYEIECVDPAALPKEDQGAYALLHAMILYVNDYPHLAVQELETLTVSGRGAAGLFPPGIFEPEVRAGIHMLLAAFAFRMNDYARADQELVHAIQASPNNPMCVYMTGEKLAADGQYVKAAESLEQEAQGTKSEWFAGKVMERARGIRDNPAKTQPLFYDYGFLTECAVHYAIEEAGQSELSKDLQAKADAARTFSGDLLSKLSALVGDD